MSIPFIDLKRLEEGFLDRWQEKVYSISSNARFIGGEEVEIFEEKLKEITLNRFAITCANGTDALQIALRAVQVEKNDCVLVPNMTFWSTFEAVVNVGANPITVDCDLEDGGVDFLAFKEAAFKFKPKAALIAHLYGWGSRYLKDIRKFCVKEGIYLIEDGAQCFGTKLNENSIYEKALISTTSFYPAKVLGGAGDGGAVFSNDENLAKRARKLCNHGRNSHYHYDFVGWNSRLDALQAAYLNLSLSFLSQRIKSRRKAIDFYKKNIKEKDLIFMNAPNGYFENGYCSVILIKNLKLKKKVESNLKKNKIGFGNIYPSAMSDQPCSKVYSDHHVGSNNSQVICNSVLNLPIFPYITESELSETVQCVKNSLTKQNV